MPEATFDEQTSYNVERHSGCSLHGRKKANFFLWRHTTMLPMDTSEIQYTQFAGGLTKTAWLILLFGSCSLWISYKTQEIETWDLYVMGRRNSNKLCAWYWLEVNWKEPPILNIIFHVPFCMANFSDFSMNQSWRLENMLLTKGYHENTVLAKTWHCEQLKSGHF